MRWERVGLHPKQSLEGAQQQQQEVGDISGPGKRWGHTCNSIKGGRFLYVFGGYGRNNCQTNQVHVYDTANQTWSQPMIKGTPPTPRDSHSCTTVADNLFVFGGTDGMNPLKDLHILDTSSHTWISPSIRGDGPEAREGHSAALVGKRLFIFGGCGKSADTNDEIYYNDLYILNTETFVWKRAATSGTPPSPRDSHTCSSWKNNVIVIGGEDGNDYYLSDVHVLDTDTLVWRELNTSGHLLPPRAGHATVAFGKNLFVFGGFTDAQNLYNDLYALDVDTGVWSKVITSDDGPSARFSVAGDCLDPVKSGVLVFVGGCNKSLEALDDMYYLYTGLIREKEWRLDKLSLRKQLKLKCQEQNFIHAQDKALVRIGADIQKELADIRDSGLKSFRDIQVDETNILAWQGLILPENPPYNKGAFRIEINFPAEYPFKPPKINFKTKIYHPNIDEKGQVCLPIISAENWKPATKADQVIQALIALVNDPEPEHPLRAELAEEYLKDRKKFFKNAEDYAKKFGEKRPSD